MSVIGAIVGRDEIAGTVTVRVPFTLRRRGGKTMIVPETEKCPFPKADPTILAALARAFRWQAILDNGDVSSITELATREGVKQPFVSKMVGLALLAPCIVETALTGSRVSHVTLQTLMEMGDDAWPVQVEGSDNLAAASR